MSEKKAGPEHVLSLGIRFVTEVAALNLPFEVVQGAKESPDHPLWEAVRTVLVPKPEPLSQEVTMSPPVTVQVESFPKIQVLHERPKPCVARSVDDQVADLERMYTQLGWTWIEAGLIIPGRQHAFDRLIVLADTTLTNNRAFGVCDASFRCSRYMDDLNSAVPVEIDQRHPCRGPYAIWVRDMVDSDINFENVPANRITSRGDPKTITLLERMLLELIHVRETREHLDTRTWTMCAGSRYSNGDVPYAGRDDDRFRVSWNSPDRRDSSLRARQVVAL